MVYREGDKQFDKATRNRCPSCNEKETCDFYDTEEDGESLVRYGSCGQCGVNLEYTYKLESVGVSAEDEEEDENDIEELDAEDAEY